VDLVEAVEVGFVEMGWEAAGKEVGKVADVAVDLVKIDAGVMIVDEDAV